MWHVLGVFAGHRFETKEEAVKFIHNEIETYWATASDERKRLIYDLYESNKLWECDHNCLYTHELRRSKRHRVK